MLTPQKVAEHSFAKASFNGYNMAQVDDFLDEVTRDYETLYNDNALLKQKLGVLTGKIKEYQSTEEAMRKTLLTAQTMADEMVKEAESKRSNILQEAEREAHMRISALQDDERAQQARLTAASEATERFVSKTRELIERHMLMLDSLNQLIPEPPAPQPDKLAEISDEVAQAVEQDAVDSPESVRLDVDAFDTAPAVEDSKSNRRADLFSDLGNNFGREAELK